MESTWKSAPESGYYMLGLVGFFLSRVHGWSPGLEQPGDCVLPVSSGISLRAMAKAMKKAAEAAPAMKKGRRRAMKARKAMK